MTTLAIQKHPETVWQPTELVNMLLSKGARAVIRHWVSQTPYLDENNQPRILSLDAAAGVSFDRLVRQSSRHLAPTVIRNELLRKGIVEEPDNGSLLLRRSAYIQGLACTEDSPFVSEQRRVSGEIARRSRRNDSI